MATREERIEKRRDRLNARSQRIRSEISGIAKQERAIMDMIPMGQPILIGHHSEKRHRRDISKMRALADKGLALFKKLSTGRAPSTAILSADDDAVDLLRQKIDGDKAKLDRMKAANKLCKRGDYGDTRAQLAKLGYVPMAIDALLYPSHGNKPGHQGWEISNLAANIRRMMSRLTILEASKASDPTERQIGQLIIREDTEAQRVQIVFPGRPAKAVIEQLKSMGFRWSPTNEAWQRHLNNAGRYAAQRFAEAYTGSGA